MGLRCRGGGAGTSGDGVSTASGACPSGETIDRWYNHVGTTTAPADEIAQHVAVVNRQLDGDAEAAAMELVAREGDDGMRAANQLADLDSGARSGVTQALNDGVPAQEVSRALNRYGELSPEQKSQFEQIVGHSDSTVGNSWLRTVGSDDVEATEVGTALRRVDDIQENNHEIEKFLTAKKANKKFDGNPPHESGSIVIDFRINNQDTFYRVYDEQHGAPGQFLTRESELKSLNSPDEVIDRLGLLPEAWERNYDSVARLEFAGNEDVAIRKSTVGKMESERTGEVAEGGGTQYLLKQQVNDGWEPHSSLEDFIDQGG